MLNELMLKIKENKINNNLNSFISTKESVEYSKALAQFSLSELEQYPYNIYDEINFNKVRGSFNYYKVLREKGYNLNRFSSIQDNLLSYMESINEVNEKPLIMEVYYNLITKQEDDFFNHLWSDINDASKKLNLKPYLPFLSKMINIIDESNLLNAFRNLYLLSYGVFYHIEFIDEDCRKLNLKNKVVISINDLLEKKLDVGKLSFYLNKTLLLKDSYGGDIEEGNAFFILTLFKSLEDILSSNNYILDIEKNTLLSTMLSLILTLDTKEKENISKELSGYKNLNSFLYELKPTLENQIISETIKNIDNNIVKKVTKF